MGHFSEGLVKVKQGEKYGFINEKGEIVIAIKYDWANDFKDGTATIREGKQGYIINSKGEKLSSVELTEDLKKVEPIKY